MEIITPFKQRFEHFIQNYFSQVQSPSDELDRAMQYAILNGGKRIRASLCYLTGELLGVSRDVLDYPACAVELIHTFSLIHDDLPAMDDDKWRRNQPTCHIAFDEATAILAGDALNTLAFDLLTQMSESINSEQKLKSINLLTHATGAYGIIAGQMLDLEAQQANDEKSISQLLTVHQYKTASLIQSAVLLGLMSSPYYQDSTIAQHLKMFGLNLGLAFQIQDDILDQTQTTEKLGKQARRDMALDKATYPGLMGLKKAQQKSRALHQKAIDMLDLLPGDTDKLKQLSKYLIDRPN